MGKKNVIILLLMPFVIALACLTSISITFNLIDTDIIGIAWDYASTEAFKVSSNAYQLKAVGQNQKNYPVMNAKLNWSVANKDSTDEEVHARITDGNMLHADSVGEVVITCSNDKGTVFRNLNAVIYQNAAIVVTPEIEPSGTNIDNVIYYGEFDLNAQGEKVPAKFNIDVTAVPSASTDVIKVTNISDNITLSNDFKTISINGARNDNELSKVSFEYRDGAMDNDPTFAFKVVKGGVNVYNYDQLLKCTNDSEKGEIVVLRKSFESSDNMTGANNVTLFGHEDKSFDDEVYRFTTKGSREFISQWNDFASKNPEYSKVDDRVIAGLRVQKDFYGNGYTLNLHNLTYPYASTTIDGNIVPMLSSNNLFRGPLPYFCLGDPNGMPLVTAYGQDNIGFYVDGNDIKVNDINLKSCDFGNNLANLDYVGTTLETNGKGITVSNSRLSNGKTVMRAFSSDVTIDNCMLSYSRNFLLSCGAYEFAKVKDNETAEFIDDEGNTYTSMLSSYLAPDATGDQQLLKFLGGVNSSSTKAGLMSLQTALDSASSSVKGVYKGHVEVKDTYFYMSNIASIALESMFNGPYLYNSAPSMIGKLFGSIAYEGKSIVPIEPKGIGGVSYPIELTISGSTRFYDYKGSDGFDLSGLINENISGIANSVLEREINITMDDIFPIKPLLMKQASLANCLHEGDICVPIAYYGGGPNHSTIKYGAGAEAYVHLSSPIQTDLVDELMKLGEVDISSMTGLSSVMKRAVLVCTGYDNFKFVCSKNDGFLYGKTPNIQDLAARNNGGK